MAQPLEHQAPRPFVFRWGFTSRFTGRAGLATFLLFLGLAAAGVAIVAFAATQQWPQALGGSAGSNQVIRLTGQTPPSVKKALAAPGGAAARPNSARTASRAQLTAPGQGSGGARGGRGSHAAAPHGGPVSSSPTSNTGSATPPAPQPAPAPQAPPSTGSGGGGASGHGNSGTSGPGNGSGTGSSGKTSSPTAGTTSAGPGTTSSSGSSAASAGPGSGNAAAKGNSHTTTSSATSIVTTAAGPGKSGKG